MKNKITKKNIIIGVLAVIVLGVLIFLGFKYSTSLTRIFTFIVGFIVIVGIFANEEVAAGLIRLFLVAFIILSLTNPSLKRIKNDIEINQDKIVVISERDQFLKWQDYKELSQESRLDYAYKNVSYLNEPTIDSCSRVDSAAVLQKNYWVFSTNYVVKYMCNEYDITFLGFGFFRTIWTWDYIRYSKNPIAFLVTGGGKSESYYYIRAFYEKMANETDDIYFEKRTKLDI